VINRNVCKGVPFFAKISRLMQDYTVTLDKKFFFRLCRKDGVNLLVVVGAHVGTESEEFVEGNRSNYVVEFEPNPFINEQLQRYRSERITRNAVALGSKTGYAYLHLPSTDKTNPGASTIEGYGIKNNQIVEVELATLDSFFIGSRTPFALQIDCEGANKEVILGAKELFRKKLVRLVRIEVDFSCSLQPNDCDSLTPLLENGMVMLSFDFQSKNEVNALLVQKENLLKPIPYLTIHRLAQRILRFAIKFVSWFNK